jgi:cysteine desulfurase
MNLFSKNRINLDYDYASGGDNPSAIYKEGVEAKNFLENARTKIARVLGVQSKEVVFTSGGTESNNLAILGVFEKAKEKISKPHIIISSLEHTTILECTKEVVRRGGEVTIIEPTEKNKIDPQDILKAIKGNTVLVSIVYANSDIGLIQPIHKISRLINNYRKDKNSKFPFFHTDASQASGYLPIQISSLGVDMMTLDASKIYGPKGTGLLVVKQNVLLYPILFGGGQENGLRSGTESIDSINKFAQALVQSTERRTDEYQRVLSLKKYFVKEVIKNIPSAVINGDLEDTLPNIVSLTLPNQLAEFIAIKLDQRGIMVSVGSSCDSKKREIEKEAIRFSFGKETTIAQLRKTIHVLKQIC